MRLVHCGLRSLRYIEPQKFASRWFTRLRMWDRRVEVQVQAHTSFAYPLLPETNLGNHWLLILVKKVKTVQVRTKHIFRTLFEVQKLGCSNREVQICT